MPKCYKESEQCFYVQDRANGSLDSHNPSMAIAGHYTCDGPIARHGLIPFYIAGTVCGMDISRRGGWWMEDSPCIQHAGSIGLAQRLSKPFMVTTLSNMLVAAMAPPTLFITTSSILQSAAQSIKASGNGQWAAVLVWGSMGVAMLAAIAMFIILNEHIHSAVARTVASQPQTFGSQPPL